MGDQITHHLNDDILASYSAGNLPEAYALVVASHLSLCDECRASLAAFDAIGGALIEDVANNPETAMPDGALAATLERIAKSDPPGTTATTSADNVLPEPLQNYVGGDLAAIRWRSVGMGVRQARLHTSAAAQSRLLYIPAGMAMPDHGHNGMELTLVLQGAFIDDGERFARGDVEVAGKETQHTPVADIGQDCICLTATKGGLRFRNILPRIAQPFLRI